RDDAVDLCPGGGRGEQEQPVRRDVVDERRRRVPADLRRGGERGDRRRRRREDDERVGALALQREDLLRDARVGGVVRLGVDDLDFCLTQADAETCVVVLPVRVVLIED